MGYMVSIIGKRNFRARSGGNEGRESLVVVNVDSKRIVRDGTEERKTSSSITKCRKNNHLIQPGETFRVVMEHVFCERDYFSIPTLSSVQFEFRSQLGYVVEINPIQ